jgi:hypothetical protein
MNIQANLINKLPFLTAKHAKLWQHIFRFAIDHVHSEVRSHTECDL